MPRPSARDRFSVVALVLLAGLALAASGSAFRTVSAQSRPLVTFNKDVAPIVFANCVSCHRPGGSAPFSLMTFAEVRQRASLIAAVTDSHFMPPWQPDLEFGEFEGDRRLSHASIDIVRQWVADGSLEGDFRDLPPVPKFPSDWQMGPPDLVVTMPEPFEVPADGPDVFRNFVVRVPISERRFVEALEFRPGTPKVVHHVRILLDESNEVRRLDAADAAPGFGGMDVPGARFPEGHFLGWTPGKMTTREAYPWAFEPGTDFVIQMHLKPSGRRETVRASIGLHYADTAPARTPVLLRLGSKTMDIPAGDRTYTISDDYELPVDVSALSIYPHAHYLGKEMTVIAKLPDGSAENLLHIPSWDFNWQDEYEYTHPIALPRGTTITMVYTYDNSADNPHNPSSPPQRTRFGQDTTDEMGELLVQVLPKDAAGAARLRADMQQKTLLTDVAGEEKIVADTPGNFEARNALAVGYVQLGRTREALDQFHTVLQASPDHPKANYNLGLLAMSAGRMDEAYEYFVHALKTRPDYAEAENNLGVLVESEGLPDEAVEHYRRALAAKPSHAAAHGNLGRILLRQGKTKEALSHFRDAVRARPDDADAQYNLARALSLDGQVRDGVMHLRRALERRPDSPAMLADLAWMLTLEGDARNPKEALEAAERANQLSNGQNPVVLDALAGAYAADEEWEHAVKIAEMAFERAMAMKNDALARVIRGRLEQYQQNASPARFR